MGKGGTSIAVIKWLNLFTMFVAVAIVFFGIWMSTHHDDCKKSLTIPIMGLGAVILLISLIGFLSARNNAIILLWVYLSMLCFVLIAILIFTVSAFLITNGGGSGHTITGLRFKEYHLQDYHTWFLKQLNNTKNWNRLKSCLIKSNDCQNLWKKYKTLKEYNRAELTPIEAGCCRPPSECGYPARNVSYYDLTVRPWSKNKDCIVYKNSQNTRCYDCDDCKAGVAQYMRNEWRIVAVFNLFLFCILSGVYFVGCCARRNIARHSSKV
ncbi:Tetraspanin-10 [Zostera marina]|uniref:Tetraspanin-10 n=1 Tax=Zostera marina TaxID=29655 RepID=A0A0K9NLJ1_ZOSMR|nr:Tetraspanin-10 [Zostera marina]